MQKLSDKIHKYRPAVWMSRIEVMRMNCEVHGQFIASLHVANVHVLFIGEAPDGVLAVS